MNKALKDKNTMTLIITILFFLIVFMFSIVLSNKYVCHWTNKGYICFFDKRSDK